MILAAVGFEPTPPKRLVPKTSALDRSATLPRIHSKGTLTSPRQAIWHRSSLSQPQDVANSICHCVCAHIWNELDNKYKQALD